MDLKLLQQEIYKILSLDNNLYLDYLPIEDENDNELDYLNNTYITYSLKNIEDLGYKDSIILEIEVVSDLSNKIKVQAKAFDIDKLLNNTWVDNCNSKIIRSNVYYMPIDDLENNKSLVTLSYKILKY
ncbi:Uncharacterised protein [uncultured Clostridium sp.]|uniref:hypothetical protein n=1 Tax=uncultured Clostridium sp. TaxID=59620 RepID=UPI0008231037|nr:hypothetical protein [uncultured Clostridium sp.]SCJ00030.1 Uncharacterised protein [uncultured Clostridium sp.]